MESVLFQAKRMQCPYFWDSLVHFDLFLLSDL